MSRTGQQVFSLELFSSSHHPTLPRYVKKWILICLASYLRAGVRMNNPWLGRGHWGWRSGSLKGNNPPSMKAPQWILSSLTQA